MRRGGGGARSEDQARRQVGSNGSVGGKPVGTARRGLSGFAGSVRFAERFRGYGLMVVIDHGHDVYSLAAGLATIHVRVDQRVTMGMRLGLAPPPSDDGNIYLEFRVGEKPEDPRRWLQLKGESS